MAKATKSKADQQVDALLEEVKKRKAEIAKASRPSWKTNMSFKFNENDASNSAQNLNVAALPILLRVATTILAYKEAFERAVPLLGLESKVECKWQGYDVSDWLDDIKQRIAKIEIDAKKEKLAKLEARLDSLISPERRRELELEAIQAELT